MVVKVFLFSEFFASCFTRDEPSVFNRVPRLDAMRGAPSSTELLAELPRLSLEESATVIAAAFNLPPVVLPRFSLPLVDCDPEDS